MNRALAAGLVLALIACAGLVRETLQLRQERVELRARLHEAERRSVGAAAYRELREEWWDEGAPEADPTASGATSPAASLESRIARLEQALAEARQQRAQVQELTPGIEGPEDAGKLVARLEEIAALAEPQRSRAVWVLGGWLGGAPERSVLTRHFLAAETDTARLRTLAEVVRAGALRAVDREGAIALCGLIESGVPTERRIAAAWAVQPSCWDRVFPEWAERIGKRLLRESDPQVLGALAGALESDAARLDPGIRLALSQAASTQPPGDLRRRLEALSAGTSGR